MFVRTQHGAVELIPHQPPKEVRELTHNPAEAATRRLTAR